MCRKDDFTLRRDALRHPLFATHGFAVVRCDMRGSGPSDGYLRGEYLETELADAEDVVAWIVRQDWCSGAVGLYGKSWGGFNGLQIAARGVPGVRAVVSLYSTDDRYADDVHYIGGAVLAEQMLSWSSIMFAWNARAPDVEHEPDWREKWVRSMCACAHSTTGR